MAIVYWNRDVECDISKCHIPDMVSEGDRYALGTTPELISGASWIISGMS